MPEKNFPCPLCGLTDQKHLPFEYLHLGKSYPLVRCEACGLGFLERVPEKEEFLEMYGSAYFEKDFRCGHSFPYFENEARMKEGNLDTLRKIEVFKHDKGRLIEIGCAGGYFLKAAKEEGWEVFGVEPSAEASGFAMEELKLKVHTGTLASASLPHESFDAAFMGDVIEHTEAPLNDLVEVGRILKRNGVLAISAPTSLDTISRRFGMFLYSVLGRKKTVLSPPYHLWEFTPKTLSLFLERSGFTVRKRIVTKMWPRRSRFSGAEKIFFVFFEVINFFLTGLTRMWGDRVFLIAVKR